MSAPIELNTQDKLEYDFHPNASGSVQFRVRAPNDAHIALTTGASEDLPIYEVFLGGWGNTKSVIRKNRSKPELAEVDTPDILNAGEYRGFWVRWNAGSITVGKEGETAPLMGFTDSEQVPIAYVGVCTGWGATGSWIIEQPQAANSACSTCWVASSGGSVPPSAFAGGEDNGEPVYVIRANYNGAVIPGKLVSSHGTGYVPWGGAENPVADYEVLCDFNGTWTSCTGADVPANAVTAGQSEDGEPLYVGRTLHDGCLTVGKVQASHGVLYIPFGGQEMGFPEYEILVA